ncbi:MAG TPA: outer membrane beta-barrel protein [Bryobacteraceae bacterium]|nr:outer membrane beta-barrel protein [Bryobacteraceae bacterium]
MRLLLLALVLAFAVPATAQNNQIGLGIGFGFYRDVTIANADGTAQAGFGPRFALSAAAGHNWGQHFGAEARYTFQDGDLELKSAGREANLDGEAHSLLGGLLVYGTGRKSRIRPFAAAGFGVKIYRGTGSAGPQPLQDFAALQSANQSRALLTFGGGLTYALSDRWLLRLDLRDYATPFPTGIIAPAPGSKLGGWLHDFVPVLSIGRTF